MTLRDTSKVVGAPPPSGQQAWLYAWLAALYLFGCGLDEVVSQPHRSPLNVSHRGMSSMSETCVGEQLVVPSHST